MHIAEVLLLNQEPDIPPLGQTICWYNHYALLIFNILVSRVFFSSSGSNSVPLALCSCSGLDPKKFETTRKVSINFTRLGPLTGKH